MEDIEALKEGDIIQFKQDDILINHCVIEVINDKGNKYYCTKGDNNNVPDEEKVKVEDIRGVIKAVVPKVGLPTVWLKSSIASERFKE